MGSFERRNMADTNRVNTTYSGARVKSLELINRSNVSCLDYYYIFRAQYPLIIFSYLLGSISASIIISKIKGINIISENINIVDCTMSFKQFEIYEIYYKIIDYK